MIGVKKMRKLAACVGKSITLSFVEHGNPCFAKAVLEKVVPFCYIAVSLEKSRRLLIPFVGFYAAIQAINGPKGESLYENPLIDSYYNLAKIRDVGEIIDGTFGKVRARHFISSWRNNEKKFASFSMGEENI